MKLAEFFANNPVFTLKELGAFRTGKGLDNAHTRNSLANYHAQAGRLVLIRRGIYAVIPEGLDADTYPIDPFLVASRYAPGAILAYHTALQFHGRAHTLHAAYTVFTDKLQHPLEFHGDSYRCIPHPKSLQRHKATGFEVKTGDRQGVDVRVTSLERTLVDVLDRPDLGGGWEEIWQSFEGVPFLTADKSAEYARLLGNATTTAKTGYFLEQNQKRWSVPDEVLARLRKGVPKQPVYMDIKAKGASSLVAGWRLIVPKSVLERHWEEPQ